MEISKRLLRVCGEFLMKARKNKNFTYITTGCIIIFLISMIGLGISNSQKAYKVQIGEKTLAIVRKEEDFAVAMEEVKKEVKELYDYEFVIPEDLDILQTKAKKMEITDPKNIIENIKRQLDMKVKAFALNIDGLQVACLKDKATINSVLEEVKISYIEEEKEYKSINFKEKTTIEEVAVHLDEVKDKDEVLQLLLKGTDEEAVHEVAAGENTWVIAQQYGMSMEELEDANPGIEPERLQIGQEISLIVPKPYLTVQTKEYIEMVETIPFETEKVETESLYKGDKKITTQGVEGEREIKGYLVKENGLEVDREIIEEIVIQKPTTRVIAEGIKERPATVATGTFARPTRGRLTSGFGARWGRRHEGIDIGASIGTSINAADAGKVSFAGNRGAYGKLVIINHENGYQTYYAHTSKILVKQGDRVYKGQHIANVGNTGRSTGPHLHFEVRKNGTPINPSQFVKY